MKDNKGLLRPKDSAQATSELIRKWSTGAYTRGPQVSPSRTSIGRLVDLAEDLCKSGWEDADVRAFETELHQAFATTTDLPTIDALLKTHEAFLRWNALWD